MPERADLGHAVNLPPHEAIRWFRSKGYQITWNWWEAWQEAHSAAFTVAKAARRDVLVDIREALDGALAKGSTEREFVRTLEPRLRALGWWGRQVVVDPDGGAERVQLGSPRRLRTIFRANVASAHAAGRWRQLKANAGERPFFQYVAVRDSRSRPAHAALHGLVFRHDDPFWDSHAPPNGWNCRCRIRALAERDLEREGLAVSSGAGRVRPVEREVGFDKRTGEVIFRPGARYEDGDLAMEPDPGWAHNPGAFPGGAPPDLAEAKARRAGRAGLTLEDPPVPSTRAEAKEMGAPILDALLDANHDGRGMREWLEDDYTPEFSWDPNISPAAVDAMRQFQANLMERLAATRAIGTPARTVQTRGKAFAAIRRASTRYPDDWTKRADAMGRLHLKWSDKRARHRLINSTRDYPVARVRGMGTLRDVRRGDSAIMTDASSGAEHEYAHRLQSALPELDKFFQDEHRARTAGDPLRRLKDLEPGNGYRADEVAREDGYHNPYQGKEYGSRALEVITMAYQPLLGEMDGDRWNPKYLRDMLRKDPDMVRLALGLLMRWKPQQP